AASWRTPWRRAAGGGRPPWPSRRRPRRFRHPSPQQTWGSWQVRPVRDKAKIVRSWNTLAFFVEGIIVNPQDGSGARPARESTCQGGFLRTGDGFDRPLRTGLLTNRRGRG